MSKKKQQKPDKRVVFLAALFALAFTIMIVTLSVPGQPEQGEFTPPPFESTAVSGTPEVPEELGYIAPWQEGMGYRFAICGDVWMEGRKAQVYLTNPEGNNVWLKLRLYCGDGSFLGETGLLKPGQYVRYVELNRELSSGTPIQLKIMGYEPDTYTSAGAAVLNTVIGGDGT